MLQNESDSDVDCKCDIWEATDSHTIGSEQESDNENKYCADKLTDGLVVWCNSFNIKQIVIALSKIRDRDWSYMRHVICTNNHC